MRALYVSLFGLLILGFAYLIGVRYVASGVTVEPQVLAAVSNNSNLVQLDAINKINAIRVAAGVNELVFDEDLYKLTNHRVDDMVTRQYYSHKTPEGVTYSSLFDDYGIDSTVSCENLQLQFGQDIDQAIEAWVNSQSHYRCLTDSRMNRVAINFDVHSNIGQSSNGSGEEMVVFAMVASN